MLFSAPLDVARTKAMHVRAELDERLREVGAHEAVGARHEDGTVFVDFAELTLQVGDGGLGPDTRRACCRSWRQG